jgi:hypothetical protein
MYCCRRLLVCPQGLNKSHRLSVYLDSPEAAFAPANLNPTASFKLSILNQITPGQGDFFKGVVRQQQQQHAQQTATLHSMLAVAVC